MNKKQAARARRRAAKSETNMPTVDELVKIGMSTQDSKKAEAEKAYLKDSLSYQHMMKVFEQVSGSDSVDAFEYALSVYNSENTTIKPFKLTDNQKTVISSLKKPHIFLGGNGIKVPFEYEDPEQPRKITSNNRPKPKDPTYDHKPRKIVLE